METNTKEKKYFVTVGMEVHAEVNTLSKMWCACKNDPFNSEPNVNVCPVCLAEPGALPVANIEALKSIIKVGLAVNGNIANFTEFDRKNYFYPDMPKAYQISQLKYPVVSGGKLAGIDLTRIHMEEDTAKSDHEKGLYTLIDFNRAGVPLMELVTEPITYNSKEEAAKASANFGKEYQRLLRTLGVSDADMEKGQLRLEANISITTDPKNFGTKCEVKNLNSFNSVEKAIMYEVDRHTDMLARGETIIQETRGWNEQKLETFSQRKKENANDYRYFPDPDLPKMYLHEIFDIEKMKTELPALPNVKKEKYLNIGLSEKQIDQLLDDTTLGKYFEESIKNVPTVPVENSSEEMENKEIKKLIANYLLTDLSGILSKDSNLKLPKIENFNKVISMLFEDELSSRGAKDLLLNIVNNDVGDVYLKAKELNLIQMSTNDLGSIKKLVEKVISENQKEWLEYKAGAIKLEMFFVGKCMKESAGSGNPKAFIEILKSL
jgi:aspartyl-tRNA(Asn)/glutamyl-tRNA(Gln) amidotransferase subunit B